MSERRPSKERRHRRCLPDRPLVQGIGGRYFEDVREAEPHQPGSDNGVAVHALDHEAAARLWQVSLDMLAG